jgi:transposase-like protein
MSRPKCEDCGTPFTEYSNSCFEYDESFLNVKRQVVNHTFKLCWSCLQRRKTLVSIASQGEVQCGNQDKK